MEQTILREPRKKDNYTKLPNALLQEPMSPDALAILVHILSRPDNWIVKTPQLCAHFDIGREKAQKALNELREKGYAKCEAQRDDKTGLLSGKRWRICEEKGSFDRKPENPAIGDDGASDRKPENTVIGCTESLKIRPSVIPNVGKHDPIQRKDSLQTIKDYKPPYPQADEPAQDGEPSFDAFVSAWGFDVTMPSTPARKAFYALTAQERLDAIRLAPAYVAECLRQKRHRSTPQAWLRNRGWEASNASGKQNLNTTGASSDFWIVKGTPEGDAWEEHTRKSKGKPPRWDTSRWQGSSIGISTASEWPPGYAPKSVPATGSTSSPGESCQHV